MKRRTLVHRRAFCTRAALAATGVMLSFVLALAPGTAGAASLVESVHADLDPAPVVRGAFTQSKAVAGFKKPLISSGTFVISAERGILWNTQQPFVQSLKLTRNEIVATQAGTPVFRMNAQDEPNVRIINGLLFSVLGAQFSDLGNYFQIDGSAVATAWKVHLVPKDPSIARMIRSISIAGDRYVRQISIEEANGDATFISLSGQSAEPSVLSASEAHDLGP